MLFAVLTGDIVNSGALSAEELDRTLAALNDACVEASGWRDGTVSGFARRGGDAWQIALSSAEFSLRLALLCHAHVRRLDKARATRIAVATGPGTLPGTDPNFAHGPAFTASGRLLETLSDPVTMDHGAGGSASATFVLADHIARGWTPAQARAMAEVLPPHSGPRSEAARRLGISRQAVDQALWSAGYPALLSALTAWEAQP
ncbi:MarR family transcriptional regulator [Tropicibacter oceani]|uniref:MarR family transcriptional regulator n=1 Tax=Tropicibacter oceani TaxID=3058420 RepID=A0ABY8QDD5_9RHOB|nr:MarR family transcriptional regulator [Tropicibacter oceani]WGW02629.1 MarR family transcriptional regulator [Tropicibacter oceani]